MLEAIITFGRRILTRQAFMKDRLVAYEGLSSMARSASSTASKTLTFAGQFDRWAARARRRQQMSAAAFAEIARRLGEGQGLAKSMRPFIPSEEAMIVEAGETSGKLQITLESLVKSATAASEIQKIAREAYAIPLVNFLAFASLSIYSGLALWPQLLSALPVKFWDGWALPMIYGQIFVTEHWWIFGVTLVAYGIYRWSLPNWTGSVRAIVDRIVPPYSAYRDRQAAALLIILAGLLRAGLTMDQSLDRVSHQGTAYMRQHTRAMKRRLIKYAGDPSRVLATGIFSNAILDRIDDAAASRQLADAIQHMGTDALGQVVDSVKRAAWLGSNVLVVLISLAIAYYAAVQALAAPMAANRLMQEVNSSRNVR